MNTDWIKFDCIQVTQPIGLFYIGALEAEHLVSISYADVRAIKEGDREIEEYSGIQRPLSAKRVKEIHEYVGSVDATFPTSIILAVKSKDAEFDSASRSMRLRNGENVAKIIDGQHRIAGFYDYTGPTFQVNVTIFVDMEIEDQAMVFATINLAQTKVNKSLAYDLYEYATRRSPQKTAHNIARLLNQREGSPFKDRIKILGTATGKPQESITQATFVDRLLRHITPKASTDEDLIKRDLPPVEVSEKQSKRLIFRELWVNKQDAAIARNIWNYFHAVQERWPNTWKGVVRGNILNRTTGFGALMRFLEHAYANQPKKDGIVSEEDFLAVFKKVPLTEDQFSPDVYNPGTSGEAALYQDLINYSGLGSK
jgi:DGQHR domain-containing protein